MKKLVTLFSVLSILTVAALLYSCAQTAVPDSVGDIEGAFQLDGLNDHRGIKVTGALSSLSATDLSTGVFTDASGNYSVSDVPVGTYILTASKYSFASVTTSVTVEKDQTADGGTPSLVSANFTWQLLGDSPGSVVQYNLALGAGDTPYIAYTNFGDPQKVHIAKYTSSSWSEIGLFPTTVVQGVSIKISGQTIYLAYEDSDSVIVKKSENDGTTWTNMATTINGAIRPDLAVANGDVYLAYVSGNATAEVLKFDANTPTWNALSSLSITGQGLSIAGASAISEVRLQVDSNGIIYLAIRDINPTIPISAKKYENSAWSALPSQAVRTRSSPSTIFSLLLNSQNNLFIAFPDNDNSLMGTVRQYDGSIWQNVGGAHFISSICINTALYFDSFDIPYAVCGNSPSTVRRLDGTSWIDVGGTITSESLPMPNIIIDSNGVPYVAIKEGTALKVYEFKAAP